MNRVQFLMLVLGFVEGILVFALPKLFTCLFMFGAGFILIQIFMSFKDNKPSDFIFWKNVFNGKQKDITKETTRNSGVLFSTSKTNELRQIESAQFQIKRQDYLSWDEYFMSVALLSAQRSKDPVTQVGACIVNPDNRIVGIGYNGFPTGCDDDALPWGKNIIGNSERKKENMGTDILNTKHLYVCHAELNAIMNKCCESLKNCTMYVCLFPCDVCAKLIIQSGIREVVYISDKNHDSISTQASRRMLGLAKISTRAFKTTRSPIEVEWKLSQSSLTLCEERTDDKKQDEQKDFISN